MNPNSECNVSSRRPGLEPGGRRCNSCHSDQFRAANAGGTTWINEVSSTFVAVFYGACLDGEAVLLETLGEATRERQSGRFNAFTPHQFMSEWQRGQMRRSVGFDRISVRSRKPLVNAALKTQIDFAGSTPASLAD